MAFGGLLVGLVFEVFSQEWTDTKTGLIAEY